MNLAGLPAYIPHASASFICTAQAPIIEPSPIVIPGPINAFEQIHTWSLIFISGLSKGISGLV